MATERLEIGSSPYGEECAQVGADDYYERAQKECRAFINQLYRMLEVQGYPKDKLPDNFRLVVKSNSHDFGTYYEVACKFNGDDEKSWELATWLEGNGPELWDEKAKAELGKV